MAYKARFSPLEILKPGGWSLMSARERGARPPSGKVAARDLDLPMSDAEPAGIVELS
jgi:arginine-tRNA-protein transferase